MVTLNLSKASIKHKLIGFTMITSMVSLLLACTVFVVYDYLSMKNSISKKLAVLANTIGTNSIVSLEFQDPQSAKLTLNALRLEKHILAAAIYNSENQLFVDFKTENLGEFSLPRTPLADGEHIDDLGLSLFKPIISDNKRIGTIFIRYDLIEVNVTLTRYLLIVLSIFMVSSLFAFFLAFRLQKMISEPILDLARTAEEVSSNRDYSIRANLHSQDEIGILIGHFNEMLDRIQYRDIALQKAQEKLKDLAKEKFELILNATGEGIFGTDLDGKTIFINPAGEAMLNYNSAELVGQSWHPLIHHTKADRTPYLESESPIYSSFQEGKVNRIVDEIFWRKDGSSFPVEYVTKPIIENQKIVGAVVTFRDISERKQNEKDLIAAKVDAEKANYAKSEFLANMSHELRTPMTAILGFAQILSQDKSLNKDQLSSIRTIEQSGNHLLDLINAVLDISKIEAGHVELNPSDFFLQELMDELSKLFEIRCRQKKLAWRIEGKDNIFQFAVHGDLGKLKQVLINLLGNAVKFTEQGEIILKVTSEKNELYRFEILDSGQGIEEKDHKTIFEPFIQSEEGGKKGGTGLGLAISYQLVSLMGGELQVDSKDGCGTRFYFSIPLPATTQKMENKPRASKKVFRIASGFKVRALVVDDDEIEREIMRRLFKKIGGEIQEAENGQVALEKIRTWRPDIIFMDRRMPVMDGEEATAKIFKEFGKDIKIVAMTTSSFDHEREEFLALGCQRFISKPFKLQEIFDCLGDLLKVKFEHVDSDAIKEKTNSQETLDLSSVSLPKDLHFSLNEAAESYNITLVDRLIGEIENLADYPELVEYFRGLAKSYDMNGILKTLKQIATKSV